VGLERLDAAFEDPPSPRLGRGFAGREDSRIGIQGVRPNFDTVRGDFSSLSLRGTKVGNRQVAPKETLDDFLVLVVSPHGVHAHAERLASIDVRMKLATDTDEAVLLGRRDLRARWQSQN